MDLYMAYPPLQGCLQHLPFSREWSSGLVTYLGMEDRVYVLGTLWALQREGWGLLEFEGEKAPNQGLETLSLGMGLGQDDPGNDKDIYPRGS